MSQQDKDVLTVVGGPSIAGLAPDPDTGWSPDSETIWAHLPDGARMVNLAGIVRSRAAVTPGAIALSEPAQDTTFAALDERSSRVAQALAADGVGRGDRVVYLGVNSPAFLEVVYGAAKLGAIPTPLNNRLAPVELAAVLADAEPSVVVTGSGEPDLTAMLPASARRVVTTEHYHSWIGAFPARDPGVDPAPEDPALILYTSGTTGLPKGIVLSGRALGQALAVLQKHVELDLTAVALAPIPYFHVSGLGLAFAANLCGSALLLEMATEPNALVELLVSRKVSHAVLVPTLAQRIVNLPSAEQADWSALRYLIYGSAPMPLPVIERATRILGCKFLQSYGLSESTGGVTVLWPEDHLPEPGRERQLTSVGRAMPGVHLRVVDPSTLQDSPVGTRGEVLIGGGHLMTGYWRKPEVTAATLTADGWLRTGDGGSFDDRGFLYLHDRIKDMIISGGENVYPAEVESVLTAHPAVAEVAVIGIPSVEWGESPYAVVVRTPGVAVEPEELIAFARDRLAHFKCPVGVSFADALPRTASGKLQKTELRREYHDVTAPQ
jgi:long-chain acyl-CoA synthetase